MQHKTLGGRGMNPENYPFHLSVPLQDGGYDARGVEADRQESETFPPLAAAACAEIQRHAVDLLRQDRTDEAVSAVRDLIARLEAEGLAGGADPAIDLAISCQVLGRIYNRARRPDLALKPLQQAVTLLEGSSGAEDDLAVALGDLANVCRVLGRFGEALAAGEQSLAVYRNLGQDVHLAVALGHLAEILEGQQRFAEADARYAEALDAARSGGDRSLQGALLRSRATLLNKVGHHEQAIELGKRALTSFQKAGDLEDERIVCNLLGNAERALHRLDAAEAWYARSHELAEKTSNWFELAIVAQNVGILHQMRAEQAGEAEARGIHLHRAVSSIEESLAIKLEMGNEIGAAASYNQLGVLYPMLDDLDRAEDFLKKAVRISESLDLPDVYKTYQNLADVARARGDAQAAAVWQARCEAKVAELERTAPAVSAAALPGDGQEAGFGETSLYEWRIN